MDVLKFLDTMFHRAAKPAALPEDVVTHPSFSFGMRAGEFYHVFAGGMQARELSLRSDPLFAELEKLNRFGAFDFTAFDAGFHSVMKKSYTHGMDFLDLKKTMPDKWKKAEPERPRRFFEWNS